MNISLNTKPFGVLLLSIGIVAVLAFIFLILFFVGYFNDVPSILFFGPLNDIFGALEAILTAILAVFVLAYQGRRWFLLNSIGVVLSWMGASIITFDSLIAGRLISVNSVWALKTKYDFPPLLTTHDLHFGFGLIGIWLLLLNVQAMQAKAWQSYLIGFGFLIGIIMIFGLAGNSPLGFVILYPIWCIWVGTHILRSMNRQGSN